MYTLLLLVVSIISTYVILKQSWTWIYWIHWILLKYISESSIPENLLKNVPIFSPFEFLIFSFFKKRWKLSGSFIIPIKGKIFWELGYDIHCREASSVIVAVEVLTYIFAKQNLFRSGFTVFLAILFALLFNFQSHQ